MWTAILIVGGTIAAIAVPYFVAPRTAPEGSAVGSPGDNILSKENIEYASMAIGIAASVGTIYMLMKNKG